MVLKPTNITIMKTNKNSFNDQVRRYYKCIRRRNNLIVANRNHRRQNILTRQIERLYHALKSLQLSMQKGVIAATVVVGAIALQPQQAQAQTTFGPLQTNPFSLTSIASFYGGNANSSFADLDNDGDLDMISGQYYSGHYYFENTGTATAPNFGPVQINPFGLDYLVSRWSFNHSHDVFVDLDGDGDFDIVSSSVHVGPEFGTRALAYYENIGTPDTPEFADKVIAPFSITPTFGSKWPTFADLDHDGDLDLMMGVFDGDFHYAENIGTATAPSFAPVQINPFSLTPDIESGSSPTFTDLDGDGDLDLLSASWRKGLVYFENIGTVTDPNFGPMQSNPFPGMVSPGTSFHPTFVDLDADNDADLMFGIRDGNFRYLENTSPSVAPTEESSKSTRINLDQYDTEAVEVNLHPNPVVDNIQLVINSKTEGISNISVLNLQGEKMKNSVLFNLQKGFNELSVDVEHFPKGVYLLMIEQGTKMKQIRFIK
jgi:hypothetical protein